MNKQAVIDHLATEVMGWHREDRETRAYWFDSDGNAHATVDKPAKFLSLFNPFENAEDAFRVLDKLQPCLIHVFDDDRRSPDGYGVELLGSRHDGMVYTSNSFCRAITIAAARASGYAGEL